MYTGCSLNSHIFFISESTSTALPVLRVPPVPQVPPDPPSGVSNLRVKCLFDANTSAILIFCYSKAAGSIPVRGSIFVFFTTAPG
jgi:hypothetical protein